MLSFFELYNLLEAKRKKDSGEVSPTTPTTPTTPTPTDSTEEPASVTVPPTLAKKSRRNLTTATVSPPVEDPKTPEVSKNPVPDDYKRRFGQILAKVEDPKKDPYADNDYAKEIRKIIADLESGTIDKKGADAAIRTVQEKHKIGVIPKTFKVPIYKYIIDGKEVSQREYENSPLIAGPNGRKQKIRVGETEEATPEKQIDTSAIKRSQLTGPTENQKAAWLSARDELDQEINKVLGKVLGKDKNQNPKRTNNKKKINDAITAVQGNESVNKALQKLNMAARSAEEEPWSLEDTEGVEMLKDMIMPFEDIDPFADGDEDADMADDPHAGMSWDPYKRDKETGKMGTYVPNDEIEEYNGDQETIKSRPKQSTRRLTEYQQRKITNGIMGFNNVLRNAAWRELTKRAALSLDLPYKFPENTAKHSFVFRLNTPNPQDKLNNQIVITLKDFKDLYYEIRKNTGLQSEFEKRKDELYNQRRAGLINDEELRSQLSDARKTLSKKRQSTRESNLAMALAYEGQKNTQDLATSVRAMRFSNHLEDEDIVGKTFTVKSLAEILARKAPSGGLETQPKEEENIDAVEMIIRVSSIKFRNLGKTDTVGRRGRQGLKMRFAKKNRQIGAPGRDPSKEYTGISDTKGAEQEQLVQTSFNIFKILDGTKMSQLSPSTKIYVNKKNERTNVESPQDDTGRFAGTGGGESRVHKRYPSMTDDVAPGVEEEKAARAEERRRRRQERKDRKAGGPLGQRGRRRRKESAVDRLMRLINPPKAEESTNWLDIVDLMNYWNKPPNP